MQAATLDDALVGAVHESARYLVQHPALRFILSHEPGVVLPYLGFGRVDRLYRAATALARPRHGGASCGAEQADWAVEWVARVVVSYVLTPHERIDLTDEDDVRRLVTTYLAPALATTAPAARTSATFSSVPISHGS